MFGRLFGGKKKKKIDPEEQKRLDKLKKEKKQAESKESLEKKIAQNEKKIADLEARNAAQYKEALMAKKAGNKQKEALMAKKAGNKQKAMRLLTNIKSSKAQIKKHTGYNTMMMKRINDMESMNNDIQMAEIFKDTVGRATL